MHFLDDKASMDVMLMERSTEYVCLAKLVLSKGEGFLYPVELGRSLRLMKAFVEQSIKRLQLEKRIELTGHNKYRIVDWEKSSFGGSTVVEADDKRAVAPQMLGVRMGSPAAAPEPTQEDFAIVSEYHQRCKVGGPYIEAANSVRQLRAAGWTTDQLRKAILAYSRTNPKFFRGASRFFETYDNGRLFFGAQYIPHEPSNPATPSDIEQMKELFEGKRGNA